MTIGCRLTTGIAIFLSYLKKFLSITATLGNALILFALCNVSSAHPPQNMLLSTSITGTVILLEYFVYASGYSLTRRS